MYHIILYIYLVGVAILSIFNKKVRKMWQGERRAVAYLKQTIDKDARYVWVHAASLGEFEQGRPIIERLREEHPEYKVLLTFFSPSGYEVRKNYEGADAVCYLPLDTPWNAHRFMKVINPVCALFIKYEFWYNYFHILKKRNIPVYSISSIFRPNQIFFRWYGHQYAQVLKCITHFFVQNEESKRLLNERFGFTNVTVSGDTRFDRVLTIAQQAADLPVIEHFCNGKRTFIAGSSWQPDEEIFIPYFNQHKDWKLVIAPHVIGEDHLRQIEALLKGRNVVRYTDMRSAMDEAKKNADSAAMASVTKRLNDADAIIINCFGLLSSIYRYADVTYVGGGFGVGIHNLLEAAVWNKPVVFGPNNQRFQEAQDLKATGGGLEIQDADNFKVIADHLLTDKAFLEHSSNAAGAYVKSKAGATEIILNGPTPVIGTTPAHSRREGE